MEIPISAMINWDLDGVGYDNVYGYYPRISGEISAHFESTTLFVPDFDLPIWTSYNGENNHYFFLPSGSLTDTGHPSNILVGTTESVRVGPGIDEFISFVFSY